MRIAQYSPDRIIDDVRRLSHADYEAGLDEFVTRFGREFPHPVSYYRFGEVSSPGVSDLDLLLVCRDQDWHTAHRLASHTCAQSERLRYLFVHPPTVVSDSVVPDLPVLHTLRGLTAIGAGHDGVREVHPDAVDDQTALVRNAVWNGYMRVGSVVSLDGATVGLRQLLLRMRHTLIGAELGNGFLRRPFDIGLDSRDLRRTILESGPAEQAEACRLAVRAVMQAANDVDGALDRQLGTDEPEPVVLQPTYFCRCVAPLSASVRARWPRLAAAVPGGWVISVPRYLVEASAAVAAVAPVVPLRRIARPVTPETWERLPGARRYGESLERVYRLSAQHGVPYAWPLPFRVDPDAGARKRLIGLGVRALGASAFRARQGT